ncbi:MULTISPECIES: response regulator [Flavobacterium]|uniref:Polar-differentiation response regulator DivK n=1 Tax=Flavobacterium anhuiense TaxID=459526 RepID=A0AAC9GKC2_9FLAO|nr:MULTISPECIES: response regulator [Flavobacterium]AOC97263.1 Polar-differentiation response regulator DivK [Flavobacterium anhuiense]EJG02835.1 response regulator receiver protein [Flavobacterium sp. F52]URM35438.1 response regulator [Flavobacterium anhuiense]SCY52409.1 Response regulator receiver domain-containing protein [Flavobacterium anhuiense]
MGKKRVLIVDDDSRNIFAMVNTLKAKSYDCISCLSAEEALRILKEDSSIDVVLIDMMMPEMDGYEAIPLIKAIPSQKSTLVVAVTAQAMAGDKEKCLQAGADAYISKPVDVDKLLQILGGNLNEL